MNKFIQKLFIVFTFLLCINQKSSATKITIGMDPLGVNYYLGPDSVISIIVNEGDSIEWFYYGLGNSTDYWTIFDSPLGTSQTLDDNNYLAYTVISAANGFSPGPYFMADLVSYDAGFGLQVFSVGLEIILATSGPLATTNANLNVSANNNGNLLHWSFITCNDCSDLKLEKSNDGINFTTITNLSMLETSYLDNNNFNTNVYYRLQYTQNNTIQYSNISFAKKANTNVSIYPNPANNFITINCNEAISSINIYNLNGVLVQKANSNKVDITTLNSGTYFTNITTTSGKKFVEKFIVQ